MIVYELVRALFELLAGAVGLEGIMIGGLAIGTVATYYLHEASALFILLARYSRMLSLILGALLVILVAGSALGVLDIDAQGGLIDSLASPFEELIHA